ncbi:hypothetical protein I552_1699 [Mycobacterium xenopi 3993]|nr:hypothetical protein I552_1699 [Mycobacterium xenopi 3993]
MHDRGNPRRRQRLEPVWEWEERVGGRYRSAHSLTPRSTANRAASTRFTWPCPRRSWHRRPRSRSRWISPRGKPATQKASPPWYLGRPLSRLLASSWPGYRRRVEAVALLDQQPAADLT